MNQGLVVLIGYAILAAAVIALTWTVWRRPPTP